MERDNSRPTKTVPAFRLGQSVHFAGLNSTVREIAARGGEMAYLVENGAERLPMWVPESILAAHQDPARPAAEFERRTAAIIVVDEFFRDPDQIRAIALAQRYDPDLRYYKGRRTHERFLWPYLREEFGRLLGEPVTKWLEYPANGVFQQTSADDPLVYHHDDQRYAAAIYLTPGAPPSGGTSFWRDRVHGCRHDPAHPLEAARLGSAEAVRAADAVVHNKANIVAPEGWELIESVAGLYNRLVIWDAKLIHSATTYEPFADGRVAPTRLVQLFFFDVG